MARIFITGSADGLGLAAAQTLLADGHKVVIHARSTSRLAAVRDLLERGAEVVVGDLSDLEETRDVAAQVNRLGPRDAVIHNADVISGLPVLPVNVVAPLSCVCFEFRIGISVRRRQGRSVAWTAHADEFSCCGRSLACPEQ